MLSGQNRRKGSGLLTTEQTQVRSDGAWASRWPCKSGQHGIKVFCLNNWKGLSLQTKWGDEEQQVWEGRVGTKILNYEVCGAF